MKRLIPAAALALAGLSFSTAATQAALPYTNGDLLLGFRASGGDGAARDYVVNVGSASQFITGTGSIVVQNLGNIGADLSSTGSLGLFGPSWHTRGEVSWGIVGTDLGSDPANTLYATRARATTNTQADAWLRRANGTQSATNSIVRAFISGYTNSAQNAVSPQGTIQATSFANSYAQFTSPSVDFGGAFSSIEGQFGNGASGTVLDLFRITPNAAGGSSQHLGHFTIDSAGALTFTFDTETLAPTLTSPATGSQNKNPVAVSFTLPEAALSGSVKLTFDNGTGPSVLTLDASNETSGLHNFGFNPASPTGSGIANGSPIADGVYSVSLSYRDTNGNTAATTTAATNVLIDATAPLVNVSGVELTGYTEGDTLPDLRPAVQVTDFSSTTVQQNPPPGTVLTSGSLQVTLTATDVLGNATSQSVTLSVAPATLVTEVLVAKDGPVPGAGSPGSGVAAGSLFNSFGIPSINDAGQVAYFAKWKAVPSSGSGSGIFAGQPEALVTKVGAAVPAISGATFKSFKDPVINASGAVAFIATIQGAGVTSADDTVIVTNAFNGGLSLVAREGATVGADDAVIKAFSNISLQGGEVLFTAKLKGGTPTVISSNDDAAFAVTSTGLETVVREGEALSGSTVKSFKLLGSVSGSSDQARAHAEGTATFLLTLVDKRQLLVDGDGATLDAFASTGLTTGGTTLPAATFKSFGFVAADGAQQAVSASLNNKVGGVTSADAKGIFLGTGSAFEPIVRLGVSAPGVTGSVFSSFSDPLLAAGAVAFPAKVKDTATKKAVDSIWWKPASAPLQLVSSLDTPVPGAAGAKWKKFVSLGLAGEGQAAPLFSAQLLQGSGGVDATNDYGIWAIDRFGVLQPVLREADTIGGKTVKSFVSLKPASGSVGAQHSFNHQGQIISRVAFTDGTTAILVSHLP